MDGMAAYATFFKIAGAMLAATGVLMLLVRARAPRASGRHAWLDRQVWWPAFCIAMGLAVVLMGAGVLPGVPRPPR